MQVVFRMIDRILDVMLSVILSAMTAVVAANVFCRFVLQFSISWGDELAQVLMVWLTFLGAAAATREKAHYAFDYLVRNLPRRAKKAFRVVTQLVCIGAILILLWYSGQVTWGIRRWIMPATEINRAFVYGACPVGCLLMLMYALRNLVEDLGARVQVEKHTEGEAAI